MWMIMCRTEGGVTGTREAPMKNLGRIVLFTSEEAAEKAMPRNHTLSTGARLSYWTKEVERPRNWPREPTEIRPT